MTNYDYVTLQELLSNKMRKYNPYKRSSYQKEEAYNEAILAAKSILSDYYHNVCEKKV